MAVVWALGFMGAVGLIGAIGLFSQGWRARKGTIVAGTIVAIEAKRMSPSANIPQNGRSQRTRTYAPVVEFTDSTGQLHRVTASLSGTGRPEVGTSVQVSYQPQNPDRAIVMELPGQAGAKWVFLVLGIVCAAIAIVVAVNG
ncbi:DUF3592 domain-containing protein [Jatrophihabitans sp. DSM 45814]